MGNQHKDIDLIYLWVDGNDPKWQAKKRAATGILSDHSETNNKGRYVNNDELRYALRSVEKHAPWIRRVFIVTDDQQPAWLDTSNPRIQVVDHTTIMPPAALPSFNSTVIEYFLYRIPGLSEHFLFANDDMFFNADLHPDFFFADDGYPFVRLKRKLFGRWHPRLTTFFKGLVGKKLGQYAQKLADSARAVEAKFGTYYSGVPHHNIDAFLKSDYRDAVERVFSDRVAESQTHHVRTFGDIHRSAFSYYALAIGHGHLKYVGRGEASRMLVYKHDFMAYMERYRPKLFCLNDNQRVTDDDRQKIKPFLEALFPDKSSCEK
ncbi:MULTISPECIES: Stealth CR1 domain-containing protein [Parapedobacter]|uniref:Stealth CR1 domain-containing protein n=1 Tax=Parapedobacter TaxID=416949 RepID=UPI00333EE8F7